MPANRVRLSQIQALTFHSDKKTAYRRTSAIPQLKCKGPACKHFQPEVVQCYNMGGAGNDVQWRCEADLPEGMRMGGVEVSCEGWSKPGDEYVLKGSCGLEYRLVELPSYTQKYGTPPSTADTVQKYIFWLFFWAVAAWLAYKLVTHIFAPFFPGGVASSFSGRRPPRPPGGGPSWFSGFGGTGSSGGTGGSGRRSNPGDPPPPYPGYRPKPAPAPSAAPAGDTWRPGFWTGLGLGGAATALYNTRRRWEYDWERERYYRDRAPEPAAPGWGWGGLGGAPRPRERVVYVQEERGPESAGPSRPRAGGDGGEMRRSTGYGGSNVR
ncbi:DUF1183-domain-containing protein [Calocera viscosa TUFC12733]|uniref:Store-operated calcium entry-associated regulatory factor n=1 Tax=Calocera viscosa (strain TUFC12733) TaxID=1330018 RepID=A0A167MGF0_CALVF|nr:DUF1183-domain-containing protein [Calocera viscosa TUFC12733]